MDLDIKRSFTWLTFGSAVTHPLWLWFTIVLLVGTLGEAEFGVINAALAFMMIAAGITSMGGGRYIVRHVAGQRELGPRFFSNFFLLHLVVATIVYFLATGFGSSIGYTGDKLLALMLAGVYAMAFSVTSLCRSLFRAHEELRWLSMSLMFEKAAVVGLGVLLVLGRPTAVGALTGMAMGMVLTLIANLSVVVTHFKSLKLSALKRGFLKKHLSRAIPFGLISFFTAIYMRTDQIMVNAISGDAANGYYSLAYQILEAAVLIPVFLIDSVFPRLSSLNWERTSGVFRSLLTRSIVFATGFGVLVAAAMYVFAGDLIVLVQFLSGSAEFDSAVQPLRILVWTLPIMGVNGLIASALLAQDDQEILALGFAVAAGFNVMANLALIPSFGPAGAAATTVMTQLLVAACLLLRYKYRTRT